MSVKIALFLYTCDICGLQLKDSQLPNRWKGYQFNKEPVEHHCPECLECFVFWKESRIKARAAEAQSVGKVIKKAKGKP